MNEYQEKKLRTLHFIILGFLNDHPFSGYDLKKVLDHQIGFFYPKESFGKIYRSLEDLAKNNLVSFSEQPSEKRDGTTIRIFKITSEGIQQLHFWLQTPISQTIKLDHFSIIIPNQHSKSTDFNKIDLSSVNVFEVLSLLMVKIFFLGKFEPSKNILFTLLDDFKDEILQEINPTLKFSEMNLRQSLQDPSHIYQLLTILLGNSILNSIDSWETTHVKKFLVD